MTPQRKKAEEILKERYVLQDPVIMAHEIEQALLDERERAIREVVSLFDSNTEKTYIKMILSLLSETDEVSR